MYLLDTNICIFSINKRSPAVIAGIKCNMDKGIYISSLTVAELEYGVQNSTQIEKNSIALLQFLSPFDVLNFDDADATAYGKLKVRLKLQGNIIAPIDMLLAAQALSKGLVFVTNNVAEFSRVEGLCIEDWSLLKKTSS